MSEIVYTPLAGKIKTYFEKFQQAGIPTKVDKKWLASIGCWSGGNDTYIIAVLKFIGFIDSANAPTELWRLYKDPTKVGAALAKGIREGYKELFNTYPDANRKDKEALYAFFSAKTGKAKHTVDYMVSTFLGLCQLADFGAEAKVVGAEVTVKPKVSETVTETAKSEKSYVPEVHINIQLHLPATNDPTIYDNLFKSLRKNLLSEKE